MTPSVPTALSDVGVLVLAATVVALVARLVRLPSIVGYLLAGLLLGPGLGTIPDSEAIDVVSEAGIVLLLFLVGLELSVEKVRKVGGIAIGAGLLQVTATGLGLFAIGWGAFGLPSTVAGLLAVALTFSSTVMVVKLLDQVGSLDERHGRIAVGILLVQDLAVLVVLTSLAGLGGTGDFDAATVAWELVRAFGGMFVLLGVAVAAAALVLPRLYARVAGSPETLLIWSLAWCFALVMGSESLGLSPELGAFIAGVSISDQPHSTDLRRRVHPLMELFVAVFFVSLGLHVQPGAALAAWPIVTALAVFTVVVKPVLVGWLVCRAGESPATAVRTGIALGQTSEFSFVLGALALELGLIGDDTVAVIAGAGLVTMGLSSLAILNEGRLAAWFSRVGAFPVLCGAPAQEGDPSFRARKPAGPVGHVIVVGMNSLGRAIVKALVADGERAVAVDTDLRKLEDLPCDTVLGSAEYLSVLHEAGIAEAKLLVSALRIEDVNRLLAYRASTFGVPVAIHVYDQVSEREFTSLGVALVLDSRAAGIRRITESLQREGVFNP